MQMKTGVIVSLALFCASMSLVSCTNAGSFGGFGAPSSGSSSLGLGSSSGSGSESQSAGIDGTVFGGTSPIKDASVSLIQTGNDEVPATAKTSDKGEFSFSTFEAKKGSLIYLVVTGGDAGVGSNDKIQLLTIIGAAGGPMEKHVTVNEITTAAALAVAYDFGIDKEDTKGNVSFTAPANAASSINVAKAFEAFVSSKTGKPVDKLEASKKDALTVMANAFASCVESKGDCSSLTKAASSGKDPAISMLDAGLNIVNGSAVSKDFAINLSLPLAGKTFEAKNTPQSIAIDKSGNLWISGTGGLLELNASGKKINQFNLAAPSDGIAIDSNENLWITNRTSNSVIELNQKGKTLGTFPVSGGPTGIALDSSGGVWVGSSDANTVSKISASGSLLGSYNAGGAPATLAADNSGNIWAANQKTNNVCELDTTGGFVGTFKTGNAPFGIAIDGSGNLWIANSGTNTVTKLNPVGTVLGTYSVGKNPRALAIDSSGNVWVANQEGSVTELRASGKIIGTVPVKSDASALAIDPSGNVWIVNSSKNSVTEFPQAANGPESFPVAQPFPFASL